MLDLLAGTKSKLEAECQFIARPASISAIPQEIALVTGGSNPSAGTKLQNFV
jgi:hypothetical protein